MHSHAERGNEKHLNHSYLAPFLDPGSVFHGPNHFAARSTIYYLNLCDLKYFRSHRPSGRCNLSPAITGMLLPVLCCNELKLVDYDIRSKNAKTHKFDCCVKSISWERGRLARKKK